MDEARFSHPFFFESRFEALKKIFPDFSNSDLTLAHWLAYIYDYRGGGRKAWSEGLLIMGYVAWKFRQGEKIEEIRKIEERKGWLFLPQEYVNKLHSGCRSSPHEVRFKHFSKDNPLVWRTLRILDEMGERDFIKFLRRWKTVEDTAKALYVLTYFGKEEESRLVERLKKEDFNGINPRKAHKRLWAALRDYVKDKTFLGKKPAGWREEELELPVDQWNRKFFEGIVEPYFGELLRSVFRKKRKKYPPREFLREFYKQRKSDLQGLYPEQFDVTFDLRCRLGDCEFCPLGGEEWKKYCKAIQESGEKSACPILKQVFGYIAGCRGKDCSLLSNPPPAVCKP